MDGRKKAKRDRSQKKKKKKNVIHVELDLIGSNDRLAAATKAGPPPPPAVKKRREKEPVAADLPNEEDNSEEIAWKEEVRKAKLVMARKRAKQARKSQHRRKMK